MLAIGLIVGMLIFGFHEQADHCSPTIQGYDDTTQQATPNDPFPYELGAKCQF